MSGYTPLLISGQQTGLIQSRENYLLPEDGNPFLNNFFTWRERYKRKQGCETLSRLRRKFTSLSLGNSSASVWTFNLYSTLVPPIAPETNASIEPASVQITIGSSPGIIFQDDGNGNLASTTSGNSGTIVYITGDISLTHTAGSGVATTVDFNYFPSLPVMGLRNRQVFTSQNQRLLAFDTKYAYSYSSTGFSEFIPGTTWTGSDSDFFWTTNYWQSTANLSVLWATNFSGTSGDPIRYTDGTAWVDFAPQVDASGNLLNQALMLTPFRGRLLALNTLEGTTLGGSTSYNQRVRWSAIGTPFTTASSIVTIGINANAWRDDIPGQGGFLDIPTNDDITCCGFVRDNLVIYCQHSTWQLRYTGRAIAPFQIERVNSELGSLSTFSAVNFDTSLAAWGDKGVTNCDSFKSERIDENIPDLVYHTEYSNDGEFRIQGVRDFVQRLVYWIYPSQSSQGDSGIYPDKRLVFNYENESWAIFDDSLTALGTFNQTISRTWANTKIPWKSCNFPWTNRPTSIPDIIGGNQQGFVVYLDSQVENDPTLQITAISSDNTNPTIITSPNHNMQSGQVIEIVGIPGETDMNYTNLNGGVFSIVTGDLSGANTQNQFLLYVYNATSGQFNTPQIDAVQSYIGGGTIKLRDNFSIVSKKFNFMDQGENIQLGYIDVLMEATDNGAITLNIYQDYNDSSPINQSPENSSKNPFFNVTVPTSNQKGISGTKYWQRVFCPVRAGFLTLEWTLSNAQMAGIEQQENVQIDAMVLWIRKAGRMQTWGS